MAWEAQLSVLLADDDIRLRETLEELLDRSGYRVLPASCGFEALEIVQAEPVDFGIFDFHMPDLTGLELFIKIREIHNVELPTIIMTSDTDEEINFQIVELGIYRLIHKPLGIDPLQQVLDELVDMFFGE
ncbi:response regulator [Planctomycetota bacterium]